MQVYCFVSVRAEVDVLMTSISIAKNSQRQIRVKIEPIASPRKDLRRVSECVHRPWEMVELAMRRIFPSDATDELCPLNLCLN